MWILRQRLRYIKQEAQNEYKDFTDRYDCSNEGKG